MKTITFYFDYLSPFSYFAWLKIKDIKEFNIDYRPVALGPLLNHWGIKGPGEVEPKREFLLKQCLRYSVKNKLSFTTPKSHPFNSLYALRLSVSSAAGPNQSDVIKALWKAGWQDRIDMGEPDELVKALNDSGLPGGELYEKSFSREAKQELKANIQSAINDGAWGVPSFVVDGELFWGNDAIADLLAFIKGEDPLDRAKLANLLASTPRGANQSLT